MRPSRLQHPSGTLSGLRARVLLPATLCVLLGVYAACGNAQKNDRAHLVDPALGAYTPQPVTLPQPGARGYIMPDGSVRIVGFDDMAGMVGRWDQIFMKTHPNVKLTPVLKGNGTAIPAITYDMALLAPEGGGATLLDLLPYEKIYGSKKDPVAALIIRVAHGSVTPGAKMSPLGIIVNKANPLASLTVPQVASIFSTGSGQGDVTGWSQLADAPKSLAGKPIHPVGLYYDAYLRPEDDHVGEYMMYRKFGAFPGAVFSPNYQQFYTYDDVVRSVAADPLAIGIVMLNKVNASVREVPMVGTDGHTLTTGTPQQLIADQYPYERDLFLYIRREPGTPLDPLVKEYVRLVLSKAGQEAVAQDSKGYLPLSAADAQRELDKLDRAATWAPRSKQGPKLNFPFPSPEPEDN